MGEVPANAGARLRYEHALHALDRQAHVLSDLRSRASIVLSATGITASLFGTRALESAAPGWISWLALACVTLADPLGSTITVEPLANIPVLTDLVVDMGPVFERFPDEFGTVPISEEPSQASPPDGIDAYERFEDCIECGLCLSACPVSATSDAYVGPAALAAAQRLLEEPRGVDPERIALLFRRSMPVATERPALAPV